MSVNYFDEVFLFIFIQSISDKRMRTFYEGNKMQVSKNTRAQEKKNQGCIFQSTIKHVLCKSFTVILTIFYYYYLHSGVLSSQGNWDRILGKQLCITFPENTVLIWYININLGEVFINQISATAALIMSWQASAFQIPNQHDHSWLNPDGNILNKTSFLASNIGIFTSLSAVLL